MRKRYAAPMMLTLYRKGRGGDRVDYERHVAAWVLNHWGFSLAKIGRWVGLSQHSVGILVRGCTGYYLWPRPYTTLRISKVWRRWSWGPKQNC